MNLKCEKCVSSPHLVGFPCKHMFPNECPYCGAAPFEVCRTRNGESSHDLTVHLHRSMEATKLRRGETQT